MELDSLASTSSRPLRPTRNTEDEEDERARFLSRTELNSDSDDNDGDDLKSLSRDLEKLQEDEVDDGSVQSMINKVSLVQECRRRWACMRRKEEMSSSLTSDGRRLVWPFPELDESRGYHWSLSAVLYPSCRGRSQG